MKLLKVPTAGIKFSKQTLFPVLAGVMLLIMAGVVFITFQFVNKHLEATLTSVETPKSAVRFDIEGFEKLNLKKSQ